VVQVAVVDSRSAAQRTARPDGAALGGLTSLPGIQVHSDAELLLSLTGEAVERDRAFATASLVAAQEALGQLRCDAAIASADAAVAAAAGMQADGSAPLELLRTSWTCILACADHRGDLGRAMGAAAMLRRLPAASPSSGIEVPPALWARVPEVNAIDSDLAAVTITVDHPGAIVWVDHRPLPSSAGGTGAVTVLLPAGNHVIAAAAPGQRRQRVGQFFRTDRKPTAVSLRLVDQRAAFSAISDRVQQWQAGRLPGAPEISQLLADASAQVAIVVGNQVAEFWGLRDDAAVRLGVTDLGDEARTAEILAAYREGRGENLDTHMPLLVEERARAATKRRREFWVYGAILGAAALGTLILVASENADHTQRIEIRGP
jgi:hypothetical protein